MNKNSRKIKSQGTALLVVLFVVMAITVLSLGFVSRSDVELTCGNNMILRTQMDSLAESGLEHAKGLILNPQDIAAEYWTGATGQQFAAGDDYYDVNVSKLSECNYQITCNAYREKNGAQIGRSSLQAQLRLDPCITYWQTVGQPIPSEVTINGDVYCGDNLTISGVINGDVYSANQITDSGTVVGQKNESVATPPVNSPGLVYSDFDKNYYIGSTQYSVSTVGTGELRDQTLGPTASNPAGIYYRNGNLRIFGNTNVIGMLVVKDDLQMEDGCNFSITAVKNFPALLVGHDIKIEDPNTTVTITGLAQVGHHIDMKNQVGSSIDVLGALYVLGDGIRGTTGCSVNITAAPDKAAIQLWPTANNAARWTPAAGAFFRSISR